MLVKLPLPGGTWGPESRSQPSIGGAKRRTSATPQASLASRCGGRMGEGLAGRVMAGATLVKEHAPRLMVNR